MWALTWAGASAQDQEASRSASGLRLNRPRGPRALFATSLQVTVGRASHVALFWASSRRPPRKKHGYASEPRALGLGLQLVKHRQRPSAGDFEPRRTASCPKPSLTHTGFAARWRARPDLSKETVSLCSAPYPSAPRKHLDWAGRVHARVGRPTAAEGQGLAHSTLLPPSRSRSRTRRFREVEDGRDALVFRPGSDGFRRAPRSSGFFAEARSQLRKTTLLSRSSSTDADTERSVDAPALKTPAEDPSGKRGRREARLHDSP